MLKSVVCAPDEKIYATCVNKSGAKCFHAKSLPSMWAHMQPQPRNYSEVIKDAPCHMYFDFDDGDVYAEWSDLKKMLVKVFKALSIELEFIVLDASLGSKRSLHVIVKSVVRQNGEKIYKYLLQSPVQGLSLLGRLKAMFHTLPLLDDRIYTRNRCFRMLGSSKYGQRRPFRGPWTMEHWVNTLVQPGTLGVHELGLKKVISAPMRCHSFPPCIEELFNWLGSSDYVWKIELEWIFKGHMRKGVCPLAGKQHRSNNRYFIFDCTTCSHVTIGCHSCRKRYKRTVPLAIQEKVRKFMDITI